MKIVFSTKNVSRATFLDTCRYAFDYGFEGFEIYDGFITLGDLFICVSKAKSQAKNYGHSMYREVCFLFTHGLLHLLKMDHLNSEDEEKMIKMQNEIMDHFKIIR